MHITGLTELFQQDVIGVVFQKNSDSTRLTTPSSPVPRPPVQAVTEQHLLILGTEAQALNSFNTSRLLEVLGHES